LCKQLKATSKSNVVKNTSGDIRRQIFLCFQIFSFCGEGPRSRSYGLNAALRLIVQPCDEDEEKDDQFFFTFPSNGAPVE
jgi:hypothetical protein